MLRTAPKAAIVRLEVATGGGTSHCSRNIMLALPSGTLENELGCPATTNGYGRVGSTVGAGTKQGQVTISNVTAAGL